MTIRWITNRTAIAIHGRQLAEHRGAPGVNTVRLVAALGWPRTLWAYSDGSASLFELAAAYAEGVLCLRPFVSGNARIGYLLAIVFLAVNGVRMPIRLTDQLAAFRAFAAGEVDRRVFAQWLHIRSVAQEGTTVIGVRRDRMGRVVGLGVLVPGARHSSGRSRPAVRESPIDPVPLLLH